MNRKQFAYRHAACALAVALVSCGCTTPATTSTADELQRLRASRFVLLGEVHDNAEQHRQRAALLSALLADGRPTTIVFEQMERDQDVAIGAAPREADAIADAGRLDRRAWAWPLHKPLVEAALAASAPIRGGNLETAEVRTVVRGALAGAPADLRSMLADPSWRADQQAQVEQEINAGHCHALPASQWPAMAMAQRARDAAMAKALVAAAGASDRAVLIAGNGHVRRDFGVPHYLRAAGVPQSTITSVGYLEAPAAAQGEPYDIVKITPAATRDDPCEAFIKRKP
jgi:uncharacterized iron-regulated protein